MSNRINNSRCLKIVLDLLHAAVQKKIPFIHSFVFARIFCKGPFLHTSHLCNVLVLHNSHNPLKVLQPQREVVEEVEVVEVAAEVVAAAEGEVVEVELQQPLKWNVCFIKL